MTFTIDDVFRIAQELSPADRCDLADRLLESVDPDELEDQDDAPVTLHPDWQTEIARRTAEIDNGTAILVPWEEVERRMCEALDRWKNGRRSE